MGPLFCVVLTVLTHFALVRYGFEWTHSDYALIPLTADEFLRGHFSTFVYNMDYGGTTLQVFRAIWVKAWLSFTTLDPAAVVDLGRIRAHSAFSYVVCPALLSLASYFVTRAYVSRSAAWVVGAIVAVGLDFMVFQFGNDAYVAYLLFGSAFLVWKASVENPFWELSASKLAMAGALTGLAIYTSRISLLYVAVFFLPWKTFVETLWGLRGIAGSPNRVERIGFRAGVGFLAFWVYLEIFGAELGMFSGRMVKVHAQPNFQLGIAIFAALAVFSRRAWIFANLSEIALRFAVLVSGFVVGFAPEWIHALRGNGFSTGGGGSIVPFSETFRAFGTLPASFREIFTAAMLQESRLHWTSAGSLLLLAASGVALFIAARKSPDRFRPPILLAALSVYAYCRMRTYTFANARYLLPILPVIWIALGTYWESIRRKPTWVLAIAALPIAVHTAHQLSARAERIERASAEPVLKRGIALIERFRREKVAVVAGDEYWWFSNNYTWLAGMDPVFEFPEGTGLRTPYGAVRFRASAKIGLLHTKPPADGGGPAMTYTREGRRWKTTPLDTLDGYRLELGHLEP